MNMKSMIAAAAVVASTVASASVFNWSISSAGGASSLTAEIYSYTDPNKTTPSGDDGGMRYDQNIAQGAFDNANYRWENGVLQASSIGWNEMTNGDWYDVEKIAFKVTPKGQQDQWATIDWSDIMTAAKAGNAFTKDFSVNGTNYTLTVANLPEPTSGLMLLLGAGMLALRRKAVRT